MSLFQNAWVTLIRCITNALEKLKKFLIVFVSFRFDRDLHSRILVSLASVLADSRAKTTADEVERLLSKCPTIPLLSIENSTIVTPDQGSIGRMVVVIQIQN